MPTSMHNVGLICHHIFWRLSVSLSKSISIPNSCDRRWREELWEIYNFGSIVLMRFFCTMSFVVDSRPSFVSATTSSTVQVRNMFVYAKLTPLILFLNKIYAWYLNMRMRLCVCVCYNSTFRLQRFCVGGREKLAQLWVNTRLASPCSS
jgi:hypothetical protein